jgi:hypothetical protein
MKTTFYGQASFEIETGGKNYYLILLFHRTQWQKLLILIV